MNQHLLVHVAALSVTGLCVCTHNTASCVSGLPLQIQTHLEGPIGMALYEWKDGQLGAASIQGGAPFL